MSKILHNSCPICSSDKINTVFTGKDYSHTGEEFEVAQCGNCQFVFTQNAPNQESIGKYYESEDYVSHSDTQKGLFFKVYHTVRKYMLSQKRKMVEAQTSKGKLLDIGCGTGYFLNEMKSNNWDVSGIEQDEKARTYGANKFSITIKEPKALYELENNSLNAITMWHVLEHVHDLNEYLTQIKNLLKKDGTLCIAVPNHDSHDGKHYGKQWAAWDLPIHLWHFTPASMHTLMDKHGFTITKHYRLPFDSFYVSLLSEKYKKGNAIAGLFQGFISYLKAAKNIKKCSSVVYIIKKKA